MNRTELVFTDGEEEFTASVVFNLYPATRDDFQIEWITNGNGERIENGETLYLAEIQQAFEEHLVNTPR